MKKPKTLKQEYTQAVKNGFAGSYKDFLGLQLKCCEALLKILKNVK